MAKKSSSSNSQMTDRRDDQASQQPNRKSSSETNPQSNVSSDESVSLNRYDKMCADSFPASDAPSTSPLTAGSVAPSEEPGEKLYGDEAPQTSSSAHDDSGLSKADSEIKNNPAAQFEYGRRTEQKTHHFDSQSQRLYMGNPDVGDVDLGTIQADQPAQMDDDDHFDGAGPNPERDRGL